MHGPRMGIRQPQDIVEKIIKKLNINTIDPTPDEWFLFQEVSEQVEKTV